MDARGGKGEWQHRRVLVVEEGEGVRSDGDGR